MNYVREGDTIVIWKQDRLGRSTKGLLELVEMLSNKGINLISLNDPINTTSPSGVLVFQIFCALAEHERNVIVQPTKAGLQAARTRGLKGERPQGLAPKYQKIAKAVGELYKTKNNLPHRLCYILGLVIAEHFIKFCVLLVYK
jgi:DNA invertase Pin-like site-specific DNA recombinase